MKEIFKDFLTLFANCLLIVSLAVASFLLLINLYHSKDVSYAYNVSLSMDDRYTSIKEDISNVKQMVNNYSASQKMSGVKQVINKCITTLENSYFYTLDEKKSISFNDIYEENKELSNEIAGSCLFNFGYVIENEILVNDDSYDPVSEKVQEDNEIIEFQTDYLKDRLLSNSTYSFMTDTTRNSIFNETEQDLFFVISSYKRVTSSLKSVASWYVDGGIYE